MASFVSLYAFILALLVVPGSPTDQPVVVHFTAPWCPSCVKMKPATKSLKNQGYDIRVVDVTSNESLARRYNIRELPATVTVHQGKIIHRRIGFMNEQQLRVFITAGSETLKRPRVVQPVTTISRATMMEDSLEKAAPSGWLSINRAGAQPLLQKLPQSPGRQLLRATVRIELRDSSGISYGSGTIIHAQQQRALVATCGHLFRESQGKTPVHVDVYYPGGVKRVVGRVLIYDANKYDVALLTIPFDGGITPIPLAAKPAPSVQQRVISAGSNGGAKPTLERTVINSLNRYEGPDNIQIHGAPAGGRSGGGLVDQNGNLIGICNAADHEDNEGFYVSSRYIALMMQRLGIEDLISNQAVVKAQPRIEPAANSASVPAIVDSQ